MENRHFFKVLIEFFRSVFGENIDNLCVKGQKPLVNRKTNCNRSEALADGIHRVRTFAVVRIAVSLVGNLAVAEYQQRMHLYSAFLNILD